MTVDCDELERGAAELLREKKTTESVAVAVGKLEEAARLGSANACLQLAEIHSGTFGLPVDVVTRASWCRRAAELGDPAGQNEWGVCLMFGAGVAKDLREAVVWLERGALAGDAVAAFNLAALVELGGDGLIADMPRALRWYQVSAEAQFAPAMNNLGLILKDGRGVVRNLGAAYRLFHSAGRAGYAPAEYNVALCLEIGAGVALHPNEAVLWYLRAQQHGYEPATAALARLNR